MSLNITVRISDTRFYSVPVMRKGLFKIKQKCLTSGKLIGFKASSNLASLTRSKDSMSRRLRSESSRERKKGRGKK